ncbi:hypothetical protein NDU88_000118 [Pleurodeles waltl]|uniref:Uncharacterized protein n=1 Tax=Pleurodeles waltl TaxID=8319 RepID=A0AAV7LDQ5_PLEWA|nr:hypothetical protein NDU88_000118 [Pleurodeles waltl]
MVSAPQRKTRQTKTTTDVGYLGQSHTERPCSTPKPRHQSYSKHRDTLKAQGYAQRAAGLRSKRRRVKLKVPQGCAQSAAGLRFSPGHGADSLRMTVRCDPITGAHEGTPPPAPSSSRQRVHVAAVGSVTPFIADGLAQRLQFTSLDHGGLPAEQLVPQERRMGFSLPLHRRMVMFGSTAISMLL